MADVPEPRDARRARDDDDGGADEVPPMLPSRGVYLLAFGAVVLAGLLGGIIGYGIADVGSGTDLARFVGTLLGSVIAAGGVGIVAVLVLRAMAEWRRTNPQR
jgi:hypothetical protein